MAMAEESRQQVCRLCRDLGLANHDGLGDARNARVQRCTRRLVANLVGGPPLIDSDDNLDDLLVIDLGMHRDLLCRDVALS